MRFCLNWKVFSRTVIKDLSLREQFSNVCLKDLAIHLHERVLADLGAGKSGSRFFTACDSQLCIASQATGWMSFHVNEAAKSLKGKETGYDTTSIYVLTVESSVTNTLIARWWASDVVSGATQCMHAGVSVILWTRLYSVAVLQYANPCLQCPFN